MTRTRLCLITPSPRPADFDSALAAALEAGDIASLLIDGDGPDTAGLVQTAIARDVAAIIVGGTDPGMADGLHLEAGGTALKAARKHLGDARMLGVGGVRSRHDAMTAGEVLPDYLFFGRIDGDDTPEIHPRALELAGWWAELFEIPAMIMGGSAIGSVTEAAAAGIEFVALKRAVWDYPDGPAAAILAANRLLEAKA